MKVRMKKEKVTKFERECHISYNLSRPSRDGVSYYLGEIISFPWIEKCGIITKKTENRYGFKRMDL